MCLFRPCLNTVIPKYLCPSFLHNLMLTIDCPTFFQHSTVDVSHLLETGMETTAVYTGILVHVYKATLNLRCHFTPNHDTPSYLFTGFLKAKSPRCHFQTLHWSLPVDCTLRFSIFRPALSLHEDQDMHLAFLPLHTTPPLLLTDSLFARQDTRANTLSWKQ